MNRLFLPLAIAGLAAWTANAGSFTSDFSNPNQNGFTLTSNSASRPDGSTFEPVVQDGHLVLTWNENSEQGTIIFNDLDAGAAIDSFTVRFKLQIGPGSGNPADGLAFVFGGDFDASANFGEEGTGNGLIVNFDTYDNGGAEAPAIDVKYNGATIASKKFAKADLVTGVFEDVEIQLTRNGMLNVSHKGAKVHENVFIGDFTPAAGLFAIGGRTGGENANQWIDDLSITTKIAVATAPSITTPPQSQAVNEGQPATFTVGFDGSAPIQLQWSSNNVAITGATNPVYAIERVAFAANGATFKCTVSNAVGSAPSAEATLTVTAVSKPLTLDYAAGTRTFTGVRVWFSDPLDPATAQNASNYKLSGGLTVTSATLASAAGTAGDNLVDLVTSAQTPGQTYTLTVNGVKSQAASGNPVAPGSTVQFSAWAVIQGGLLFEHWDGLSGAADGDIDTALANPRVVSNSPTTVGLATRFDTRTVFPDDSHENHLVRLSGWITPTESADYYFFLRADDAARLYLSANETIPNPATDTPIATEPDCCDSFYEPDSGDPATTATPISLQSGKRYGVLALLKEATGGDYLMVAWRKSTDTTAAANLPYLPGQFLSTYVDPNADIQITKQPTDQPGVLPSTGIEVLSLNFKAGDAGFTVTNTDPVPPGPWVYDATTGAWVADGSEDGCTGPYNSQLNSAPYKLTQDGALSLVFSHRYSFEDGLFDAGQIRLSVNGGPFTLVPASNFSDNGYAAGAIVGTGIAKGLNAFNGTSPGYADSGFITSKALLGSFSKDDSIVVQFVGAWDECSSGSHPNWVLASMKFELLPAVIQDFSKSNGNFTVENTTPAPPGPWTYDSTNGVWFANGSEEACTGPYNSKLTSPRFTVTQADEVTLNFSHRYSFESGLWDAGQVRISVNGGAFAPVPAENFTANGYAAGAILGTGVLKDQRGFNADSTGYAASSFVTSSAVLGTFAKGDTIAVQFVGAWDECSGASHPSWVIKNLQLVFGKAAKASTFEGAATATRQGKSVPVAYQWQRDDGAGFKDIPAANGTVLRLFPVAADFKATFRLVASVPGKSVNSSTVKLTEGAASAPDISIARTGAAITITYTGTLQSSAAVVGPYQDVPNSSSPYSVPSGGGATFYRSAK